jgi:hypothetical protein
MLSPSQICEEGYNISLAAAAAGPVKMVFTLQSCWLTFLLWFI